MAGLKTVIRPVRASLLRLEWMRFNCQSLLGASLAGQKKYAEAEPLLLAGYNGMLQRAATLISSDWVDRRRAGEWIVSLYQAWKKPAQAAAWRAKLSGRAEAANKR